MGENLLVDEQLDAGDQFVRDFSNQISVDVAFWINPADSDRWYLYIASSEIDDGNIRAVYGEVLKLAGSSKNQWLDAFQIKLLNRKEPLAQKVIEIRDWYLLASPMRYNGTSIAGMAIDAAYIYPPLPTPTSTS